MLVNPPILALLIFSALASAMLLYSCVYGIRIIKGWDIKSGSEYQLSLERRTYLISTIINYVFVFQLLSFFVFIYTADQLHTVFAGAMCAAGTLNLNEWGYRTVLLKFLTCVFSGVWLLINYVDNRGYDYPLIKKKYGLLLLIAPFALIEGVVQGLYFFGLEPDVITSCCGTLFTSENEGITAGIVSLPRLLVQGAFFGTLALTVLLGIAHLRRRILRGYPFALSSIAASAASAVAFMSVICLFFYESPLHHCPFCVLQKGYGYIGYPIYFSFLAAAVSGPAIAVLDPLNRIESLKTVVPSVRKRLIWLTLGAHSLFAGITIYEMIFSKFQLQ